MAGRVYVITGASGVLGSAVARAVAEAGSPVALIDFAQDPPAEPAGPDVFFQGGVDLTDANSASAAIDAVADRFGGLDVLLNIAGGFSWQTHENSLVETWHRLFLMNVQTASNASRAAIPHLRRSAAGRIVNVGANAALKASMGMGAYAASKAGVHSLTQALSEELKADGITVNAVLPSIIDTPTNRADMPKADASAWVTPTELAAVMLFLASPQASAVTGALIPVTGRV
ncbi:MAG TPA: SDR family NAD(P)-dependent oxidoreductase [Phenylobacterium sp.]|jgi:NAD(P)-dependent dehydrogenase (short-subunit alcohol dehydrogenase family)|uniref:SDR family NAD(P)-dependent oxidoreductase n=1 Tax=Phenylobacterium sp. TaxID=1871053 RepID=UPI002D3BF6FD|nr:SDR family NAD(P)-dependent oxidoreductase [Phenylobacterium sp.]HZZ69158.1 SDR family NAD(P)-dependent oxidoreductase [Phenylobacterium sp.]